MKQIIIGLLVLASFSALAQSSPKLDLALANKAVCKKAIKTSLRAALDECIESVRSLKLTHDQTLESYPPIEVYNFIKVLRIDNKLFDCRGDLGVSQNNTVYKVGGIECKALN